MEYENIDVSARYLKACDNVKKIVNAIKKINTKVAEVEIEVNPENINNVVGHKKENIQKLKELYDVDVRVKQSFNVRPNKFNVNIVKTYKEFLDD